jgi:hypothetical protein
MKNVRGQEIFSTQKENFDTPEHFESWLIKYKESK